MTIYQLGIGDRLIDPLYFTDAIKNYLSAESTLLRKLCAPFSTVVEAGCTRGRYAGLAHSMGKNYVGIDNVPRYIEDAEVRYGYSEEVKFLIADAGDVSAWLPAVQTAKHNCLLVFPFNMFGIIRDPLDVMQTLQATGMPFVVMTFSTSRKANEERMRYYRYSGFNELQCLHMTEGVRFIGENGLDSIAYNASWLTDKAQHFGFHVRECFLGVIGKAFFFY